MRVTGDPFVDTGNLVLDELPQKTLEEKIRFATDVFVDRWRGKINTVFLHSKITHIRVAGKPQIQRARSLDYYSAVLQNHLAIANGACRICGATGPLFSAGRDNYPLVGSGEFVNFHHNHETGLLLCRSCVISLFFVPLGVLQASRFLILLQTETEITKHFWADTVIQVNLDKIAKNTSESILKSEYSNPVNGLFFLASRLIQHFEMRDLPEQNLRLFYFTNFAADVDVHIYDLPSPVFRFLKRMLKSDLKKFWFEFVKRNFVISKEHFYDESLGDWFAKKKSGLTKADFESYAGFRNNRVFIRLLNNGPMLRLLLAVHKKKVFPLLIAITYLQEVRGMREDRVKYIKELASDIVNLAEEEGDYKKILNSIEGPNKAFQLRRAILRFCKKNLKSGESAPLVTSDQYVDYLFPDDAGWHETRDFLLICLYEKMHQLKVEPAAISDTGISLDDSDNGIDDFNAS